MARPRINASDDSAIIRQAFLNGWSFCEKDEFSEARNITLRDLDKLAITDRAVQQMFRAGHCCDQSIDRLMAAIHPSRSDPTVLLDDEVGPALRTLATIERCAIPDALIPADVDLHDFAAAKVEALGVPEEHLRDLCVALVSSKQWEDGTVGLPGAPIGFALGNTRSWDGRPDGDAAGCDLQDPFKERVHSVRFLVDLSNAPSSIRRWWPKIAHGAQECMRHKGYRIRFVTEGPHELYIRWMGIGGSTIGWFTIFSGGTCLQTIGGRMDIAYAPDWYMVCLLLIHEALFHGFGHQHTRGGIGNPSILRTRSDENGNPTWIGDPAERSYDGWGGGKSVTLTGDPVTGEEPQPEPVPPPSPDPDPDLMRQIQELINRVDTLDERVAQLPTTDAIVQDVLRRLPDPIPGPPGKDGVGFTPALRRAVLECLRVYSNSNFLYQTKRETRQPRSVIYDELALDELKGA